MVLTIYAMKITENASLDQDKLTIMFNDVLHALEVMTAEIMVDMIDYLLNKIRHGSSGDALGRLIQYLDHSSG